MKTKAENEVRCVPELYSISVVMRPLQPGAIPLAHGYHVYALFLNIIRASNPVLAEKLHADDAVKPFTTSTLIGKTYRKGAQLTISMETALSFRLTFLYSLLTFAEMWKQYRNGNILGLRYHPLLSYTVRRNINPKNAPELTKWTNRLLSIKPGNEEQLFLLDNLGLIAQLLILSKEEGNK